MALWTQRLSISWRQNIGFFEHRYDVLRNIERKGLLRRFLDSHNQIVVRLQGPHQLVTFRSEGMDLSMLRPDADIDVMRAAADAVCDALEPVPQGFPVFRFQWLVPCASSYEDARHLAADAFVGVHQPARMTDFALLLDGKCKEPFDDWHLEFGVVDAAEAPRRLARGTDDAQPELWRPEDLPPVAIFCDIRIDRFQLGPGDIVDNVFSAFESAREAADKLMSATLKPLQDSEI
jgi:hypothetical protein